MRANWEIAAFNNWLKTFNEVFPYELKVVFYGLDVFSFRDSMNSIIEYLEKNDPEGLKLAKKVMECFEPCGRDGG